MNKQMVPLTLGLAAIAVGQVQSQAVEPSSDRNLDEASQKFSPSLQSQSSGVVEMAAQQSELAPTEMPVSTAQSFMSSDSSGVLDFEPPSVTFSAVARRNSNSDVKPVSPPQSAPQRSGRETATTEAKPMPSAHATSIQLQLFEGGSESLVARTVGAAEGTRAADGSKTPNYYGHIDPGNGVWNRGTFSYQFGNQENLSPDEADRRQLAKIKRIYESVILPKAEKFGIAPLTIAEEINGIDLINQAPLTVTEAGGYIERLAEVKKKGLSGEAAILEARVLAFWDPDFGGWDAPGLRAYDDISKEESIRRDQNRRMSMISQALAFYEQQNGQIAQTVPKNSEADPNFKPVSLSEQVMASVPAEMPKQANSNAIADAVIFNGL